MDIVCDSCSGLKGCELRCCKYKVRSRARGDLRGCDCLIICGDDLCGTAIARYNILDGDSQNCLDSSNASSTTCV